MMRFKMLIVVFFLLLFVTSCSNNGTKPIEGAKEIQFIVISEGIAVNSGKLKAIGKSDIIKWHNNVTFVSMEKENPIEEALPMVEKFSNSSFRIHIEPNWNVTMIYRSDNNLR